MAPIRSPSGVVGAIAPAYAITTHVAQGQTMDAGRAVITESTAPEAAYVALTRGRNETRLYVLDSPARTERRIAAQHAEFRVLLDEPDLLAAVAERLQQRTAIGTATSLDPVALNVHRLSLRPFDELKGPTRQVAAARRVAVDRAVLRALIDTPSSYVADYGRRPAADDPHRPIWDRAVRTRAEYELVYGRWNPLDGEVRHAHNAATAAAIDRLPVRELNNRLRNAAPGAPELEQLLGTIRDRIARAVAEPADYLTDLIGHRPSKGYALQSRWDDKANAIETVRHRNGLDPSDGIASRTFVGVLGGRPNEVHAATDWLGAARVVEHAINPQPIDRDELRLQAPRLRR